jgi:transcriptional antiterminator
MENARAHNLYMIHIINKDSKGIQIYLDMTKDIEKDYEQEFWTVIRSIRETPH